MKAAGYYEELKSPAIPRLNTPQTTMMGTCNFSFYFYFQLFTKLTQFILHNASNLSLPFDYFCHKPVSWVQWPFTQRITVNFYLIYLPPNFSHSVYPIYYFQMNSPEVGFWSCRFWGQKPCLSLVWPMDKFQSTFWNLGTLYNLVLMW